MPRFQEISPQEANLLLQADSEALVLDMRDRHAFQLHHHPRAISLDETTLKRIIKQQDKTVPIIVVCYHGNSSKDIAQLFLDFGFTASFSLTGGYDAWKPVMNAKDTSTTTH
jgi:rhodanese-related sulfurtransferase